MRTLRENGDTWKHGIQATWGHEVERLLTDDYMDTFPCGHAACTCKTHPYMFSEFGKISTPLRSLCMHSYTLNEVFHMAAIKASKKEALGASKFTALRGMHFPV